MQTLVKTLFAENGNLFAISSGERHMIAGFTGRIKIYEDISYTSVLGKIQKGPKTVHASVIVCGDVEYTTPDAMELVSTENVFEATAIVQHEKICFAGLQFEDSDPWKNELIFNIPDLKLIERLYKLED